MFFKNRPTPASFIVYFRSFQTNIIIIFQQIYVKIRPSSIRDSKPQPLEHEPPPITTRPGLPLGLIWKGLHRSRASSRGDFFLCCPATKDKSQQGGGTAALTCLHYLFTSRSYCHLERPFWLKWQGKKMVGKL